MKKQVVEKIVPSSLSPRSANTRLVCETGHSNTADNTHSGERACVWWQDLCSASFSVQIYLIKKEVCWQHRIPWKTPLRIFSLRDHYKMISFADFASFRCVFEENEHLDSVKYWKRLFPIKILSFRFFDKWSTSQKRCTFRPQIMGRKQD